MSCEISEITELLLKNCPELRFYSSSEKVERTACRYGALVYFAAFRDSGPVKVGFSRNPRIRLTGLETSCGRRLRSIVLTRPHKNYMDFEAHLHWKLHKHRGLGEWFNLPMERILQEYHQQKHMMRLYFEPHSDEQIRRCGTY